jgi:hypothetical protein
MKKIKSVVVILSVLLITVQSCSKDESTGCDDAVACNFNSEAELNDGSCIYASDWFLDLNGDGYGNSNLILTDCNQPVGYTKGKCDLQTFYKDEDEDGLGDPNNIVLACNSVLGYVRDDTDNIDAIPVLKQRAVIVYQGATWCGPCGANGDPTKKHLEETYGTDVIILNCQSGDEISDAAAFGPLFGGQFANFFTPAISSIPHCYFSAANYVMTDHGFATDETQFDAKVEEVLATNPKVGISAVTAIESGVVTIHTSIIFSTAADEHYMGIYLLEDGVMNEQVITGSDNEITEHNNVLRAASSSASGDLGIESLGNAFVADEIVSNTYTITVPSTVLDNSKLQIGVVVWSGSSADKISNGIIVDVNL